MARSDYAYSAPVFCRLLITNISNWILYQLTERYKSVHYAEPFEIIHSVMGREYIRKICVCCISVLLLCSSIFSVMDTNDRSYYKG